MMEQIAAEVIAQEEQLTRATQTLDLEKLDRLYADDIMMTSVLGETSRSKAAILDEARRGAAMRQQAAEAGKPITTTYTKEDLTIMPLGDAAVTSYRFVVEHKGASIHVYRRYRTTNIWARQQGRWQVVAAHTAFVLDPTQAAKLTGEPR
jgi:ketosteroid isomerase-like protein